MSERSGIELRFRAGEVCLHASPSALWASWMTGRIPSDWIDSDGDLDLRDDGPIAAAARAGDRDARELLAAANRACEAHLRLRDEARRRQQPDWIRPIDRAWCAAATALLCSHGEWEIAPDGQSVAYAGDLGAYGRVAVMLPGQETRTYISHAYRRHVSYTYQRSYERVCRRGPHALHCGATWWPAAAGWDDDATIAACRAIAGAVVHPEHVRLRCDGCWDGTRHLVRTYAAVPELADLAPALDRWADAEILEAW